MNLVVKIMEDVATGDGCALVLCTEDGTMLPCQTEATLTTEVAQFGRITVTFAIDGDQVRLEPTASDRSASGL